MYTSIPKQSMGSLILLSKKIYQITFAPIRARKYFHRIRAISLRWKNRSSMPSMHWAMRLKVLLWRFPWPKNRYLACEDWVDNWTPPPPKIQGNINVTTQKYYERVQMMKNTMVGVDLAKEVVQVCVQTDCTLRHTKTLGSFPLIIIGSGLHTFQQLIHIDFCCKFVSPLRRFQTTLPTRQGADTYINNAHLFAQTSNPFSFYRQIFFGENQGYNSEPWWHHYYSFLYIGNMREVIFGEKYYEP